MPAGADRLRHVLRALAVGAATIGLAACGGKGDGDANGSDAATRTVTDARGTAVEVPVLPQRVVTLSEPALDGALSVGLRPVASTSGSDQGGVSSYLARPARGVVDVGAAGRPNVEHVAALKPDLILVDDTAAPDRATIDRLRRLAPIVHVSKAGQDWRTAFTFEADALNRQKEGAHVLHEFDARVAQVRDALGANAGARVSVVTGDGTGPPSVLTDAPAVARLLDDLGLEAQEDVDGDWMFFGASGTAGASGVRAAREAYKNARDVPGFTKVEAVRKGHVVPVDGSAWTSAGGPIAAREVVDDVARPLTSG